MNNLSWELIQSFVAVVKAGSLSGAAKQLKCSQPTLTRHIQALEKQLQLQLFYRSTQGLTLTLDGQKLLEAAYAMQTASEQFNRQASGLSEEVEGTIRLSANEIMGVYTLPPALVAFRRQHPQVQIELVISNQASRLSQREADVALRMFQPTQLDLRARRLPDIPLGFYAHADYLEDYGVPSTLSPEILSNHVWIGYDENPMFIEGAAQLGFQFQPKDFDFRCDHMLAQIALARAGGGIILTHIPLASQWPEMVPILPDIPVPPLPVYLVSHQDTYYNRLVRTLTGFLSDWFVKKIVYR